MTKKVVISVQVVGSSLASGPCGVHLGVSLSLCSSPPTPYTWIHMYMYVKEEERKEGKKKGRAFMRLLELCTILTMTPYFRITHWPKIFIKTKQNIYTLFNGIENSQHKQDLRNYNHLEKRSIGNEHHIYLTVSFRHLPKWNAKEYNPSRK